MEDGLNLISNKQMTLYACINFTYIYILSMYILYLIQIDYPSLQTYSGAIESVSFFPTKCIPYMTYIEFQFSHSIDLLVFHI